MAYRIFSKTGTRIVQVGIELNGQRVVTQRFENADDGSITTVWGAKVSGVPPGTYRLRLVAVDANNCGAGTGLARFLEVTP